MVELHRRLSASRLKLHLVPGSWKSLKDPQSKNSRHAQETIRKQQAEHLQAVAHRPREACWNYSHRVKSLIFKLLYLGLNRDHGAAWAGTRCWKRSERRAGLQRHARTPHPSPPWHWAQQIWAAVSRSPAVREGRQHTPPKSQLSELENSQGKWKIGNFSGKEGM